MLKYSHGLIVGRFQPFHIGHERIIDQMLEECELVTVIIGSIQEKGTEANPFSFEDRKQMIKDTYGTSGPIVTGLCDLGDPPNWAKFVLNYMKDFSVVPVDAYYAGSKIDYSCFEGKGLKIVEIPRNSEKYPYSSGTMIRNMMRNQDVRWKLYVPKTAQKVAEKLYTKYMYNQIGHLSSARSKISER